MSGCAFGIELRREGLIAAGWVEAEGLSCAEVHRLFRKVAALIYRDHSLKEVGHALGMNWKSCQNDLESIGTRIRPRGSSRRQYLGGLAKAEKKNTYRHWQRDNAKPKPLMTVLAGVGEIVLRQCPVTGGQETRMSEKTFTRMCARRMFIDGNRQGYCGVCRGKIRPPELRLR